MYRDSTLVKTGTVSLVDATGTPLVSGYPNVSPTEIDVGGTSPWTPGTGGWAGAADEFTIWNGVLTQANVTNLYASNAIATPEPSTAVALMTAGLVGLLAYAWRKRK